MIDLKKVREAATRKIGDKVVGAISQADIAQHLGITQGQVSKYEAAPETIPTGILIQWLKFLGHDLETALKFFAEREEGTPLDPGDAYKDFFAKKQLLLAYLEAESTPCPTQVPKEYTPEFISSKIERIAKRPNLVYAGMFDSGKSRMINEFLGMSILPVGYQPETQLNHIVLHSSEKPDGMAEDVIILKTGFDLDRRTELDHVMEHKVIMGGYEILREYGSHKGGKKNGEAALVFADSPILKACNIIDTPGDLHDENDTGTASKAIASADIVIIPSSVIGFLSGPEAGYIDNIIRRLPAPDAQGSEFPTLGNLFIVATHAGPNISDQELQNTILPGGCKRLWDLIGENSLAARAKDTGRIIDEKTLYTRFFSFYAEMPKRRQKLEDELSKILGQAFPRTIDMSLFRLIEKIKEDTGGYYNKQIDYYEQAIKNREDAKARLQELKDGDEEFKETLTKKVRAVFSFINEKEAYMSNFIDRVYSDTVNPDHIERLIRAKYGDNKKLAQEYISHYIMGELQKSINEETKEACEEFTALVEDYLSTFDFLNESETVGIASAEIPFNAKGALLGGMAGLAGVGALAVWASTLGNLGAYIIAAKGASVLAALGISLSGGAAAVTSALAAIGGPVTVAVGLVVGAILLGLAIFGDSWQRRLAKNVTKQFAQQGVASAFQRSTYKFWEQTWEGFEKGSAAVRENYDKHIADLDAIINDPEYTIEKMTELVNTLKKVRDFLDNMPWKAERK